MILNITMGDDFSNIVNFPVRPFASSIVSCDAYQAPSFNIRGKICDYCAPATAKEKRIHIKIFVHAIFAHKPHIHTPYQMYSGSLIENLLHTI